MTLLAFTSEAAAQTPGAPDGELEIVKPDSLSVTYERSDADAGTVWIKNTGDTTARVSFVANVQTKAGKGEAVVASSSTKEVAANQIERFRIELNGVDQGRLEGELVAHADGYAPASVDLTIGPKRNFRSWINFLLLFPLAFAVLFVGARWRSISRKFPAKMSDRLGPAKFDFSKSFASTITVVGALLGTAITAGVLPDEPERLTKDEYLSINLLFGAAIVVAGVVFAASEHPTTSKPEVGKEREYQGSVWALLASAVFVVAATVGQALCLALIIGELSGTAAFTPIAIGLFWLLLGIALIAVLSYTYRRIFWIVENKTAVTAEGESQPALPWSLL